MSEATREDLQQKKKDLLKQLEQKLSPEDLGCFLAISQGFAQSQNDTQKNVQFVLSVIGKENVFWGKSYKLTIEALRRFNAGKSPLDDFAKEMMELQHGLARIHVSGDMFVAPHALGAEHRERATNEFNRVAQLALDQIIEAKRK